MIEVAKEQVRNAHFIVADGKTWEPSIGGGEIGAIVAYFSFIAGVSQSDIRSFFSRAFSWLPPGGCFVFGTVPVEGENIPLKWMGKDVVVSSLSGDDTVKAIEEAGFTAEKYETEMYRPKAVEAGICSEEDVWDEPHLLICAKKPA